MSSFGSDDASTWNQTTTTIIKHISMTNNGYNNDSQMLHIIAIALKDKQKWEKKYFWIGKLRCIYEIAKSDEKTHRNVTFEWKMKVKKVCKSMAVTK